MYLDLDFGTCYSRFLVIILAYRVKVCTQVLKCCSREELFHPFGTEHSQLEVTVAGPIILSTNDGTQYIMEDGRRPDLAGSGRPLYLFEVLDRRLPSNEMTWEEQKRELRKASRKYEYFTGEEGVTALYPLRTPYAVLPRRMWDLKSRRVIPVELLQLADRPCEDCNNYEYERLSSTTNLIHHFWAVTHSWADNPIFCWHRVNGYQWPVPLPPGVNLFDVARELTSLLKARQSTIEGYRKTYYCWLELVCLRQGWEGEHELQQRIRTVEHMIDVPTIGNVYQLAQGTIRYMNGLGNPISASDWAGRKHWLNRAWTLQEVKLPEDTLEGGLLSDIYPDLPSAVKGPNPLEIWGSMRGNEVQLRSLVKPLEKIAKEAAEVGGRGCSVIELLDQMRRRYSTSDTDKITGMNYLLRSPALPAYLKDQSTASAWLEAIKSMRTEVHIELLFNFPLAKGRNEGDVDEWGQKYRRMRHLGPGDIRGRFLWAPTWSQAMATIEFIYKPIFPIHEPSSNSTSISATNLLRHYGILRVQGAIVLQDCSIYERLMRNDKEKTLEYLVEVPTRDGDGGVSIKAQASAPHRHRPEGYSEYRDSDAHLGENTVPSGHGYTLITHDIDFGPLSTWIVCRHLSEPPSYPLTEEIRERMSPSDLWLMKLSVLTRMRRNASRRLSLCNMLNNQTCYFI